jgi:hypothetical protein
MKAVYVANSTLNNEWTYFCEILSNYFYLPLYNDLLILCQMFSKLILKSQSWNPDKWTDYSLHRKIFLSLIQGCNHSQCVLGSQIIIAQSFVGKAKISWISSRKGFKLWLNHTYDQRSFLDC